MFVLGLCLKLSAQVPVVFRVSEGIRPNSLVSLFGEYLTGTLSVKFVKHDGSIAATVQAAQGDSTGKGHFCRVIFPVVAPGVYAMYVSNSSGQSAKPLYINKACPRWIWQERMYAGMKNKLLGRNLDATEYNGAPGTKIRLVPTGGGTDITITPDKVTPYCLDFTLPASIANGTYYIETCTNSAEYGIDWVRLDNTSDLPATVENTVINVENAPTDPTALELGVAWANDFNWTTVINVKSFGAVGDSIHDDTQSIKDGLANIAASGGGVLYFPNGKYILNDVVYQGYKTIIKGESKEKTVIWIYRPANAPKTKNWRGIIESSDAGGANSASTLGYLGICNISLKVKPVQPDYNFIVLQWGDTKGWKDATSTSNVGKNLFIYNVDINTGYPVDPAIHGNLKTHVYNGTYDNVLQKNSQYHGDGMGWSGVNKKHTSIIGCSAWTTNQLGWEFGGDKTLCEGNYYYNHNDLFTRGGQLNGFFAGLSQAGTLQNNLYVANNKMDIKGNNDCQSWAIDSNEPPQLAGMVISSTDNTVNIRGDYMGNNVNWANEEHVLIMKGKGMGQIRRYIAGSHKDLGGTPAIHQVEVSPSWDIQPDSSSMLLLRRIVTGCVFENNLSVSGGISGFYRGQYDCIAANDVATGTNGVYIWGTNNGSDDGQRYFKNGTFVGSVFFNQVKRSHYSGKPWKNDYGYAITVGERAENGEVEKGVKVIDNFGSTCPGNYGNEWRDNFIDKSKSEASGIMDLGGKNGIGMNSPNVSGAIYASLVEGNTFKGADYGVGLQRTNSVVIRGNTLIDTPNLYTGNGAKYTSILSGKPDPLKMKVQIPEK